MSHYESTQPYHSEPMNALVVYCSDGRVCEQCDEFITRGLDVSRYDRVTVPGGPASLVGHDRASLPHGGVLDDLKLLVDGHNIDRIILIQHEDCAFYKVRLGVDESSLEHVQKADLGRAADLIRQTIDVEHIDGYFARRSETGVAFEPVEVG